ncbi:MAG: hypothetical protein H6872_11675 [Methylobacteriaceae bacterium]|nr:hypothetical protein [Methylobacteriaceae bacterium]
MTRDQAQIVEDSFTAFGPVTLEMGETFYDNLFEIAPTMRALFLTERLNRRCALHRYSPMS